MTVSDAAFRFAAGLLMFVVSGGYVGLQNMKVLRQTRNLVHHSNGRTWTVNVWTQERGSNRHFEVLRAVIIKITGPGMLHCEF
jgi:hypothetical protein